MNKLIEFPEPAQKLHANLEAEQQLLSMLMSSNASILQVPRHFTAESFYAPLHQRIFAEIRKLFAEGTAANPITMKNTFAADPDIQQVGGIQYLVKLVAMPFLGNVAGYCDLIHQEWLRRQLSDLCMNALTSLNGSDVSPVDAATDIAAKTAELIAEATAHRAVTDYDVGLEIMEDIKQKIVPFSTGIQDLDTAMGGGLLPCKLYGFAARKKVGKTIMAATISYNLSKSNVKHLLICAEMSSKEVQQRILARETDSFESAFRTEYGQSIEFQTKLANAVVSSTRCRYLESKPGITFQELQQIIPVYAVRHKIKGFILDYWQLVGGKPKNKSTSEHLDDIAQWLATICRKYKLFGIVMAQINQDGNTRGSEGLRLAADQVYELHREDITSPCAWLEMMETRYTKWLNIGSEQQAGIMMNEKGPYFE